MGAACPVRLLSMECERLAYYEVGESIEEAYRAASTDDPQSFLTQFYKCYRACVRAKVATLRANQTATTV